MTTVLNDQSNCEISSGVYINFSDRLLGLSQFPVFISKCL